MPHDFTDRDDRTAQSPGPAIERKAALTVVRHFDGDREGVMEMLDALGLFKTEKRHELLAVSPLR